MELIQIDDVKKQIEELKKLVRVVSRGEHSTLVAKGVREVDFLFSKDMEWIEPSGQYGLSFATSIKKLKSILKTKARFVDEVEIYAIDSTSLVGDGLNVIFDRPGHASLTVTRRMKVADLIKKLEQIALKMDRVGRLRISP